MVGKASSVDVPAAVLAQYVGEYEAQPPPGDTRPAQIVTIALTDGTLTITTPFSGSAAPLTALSETNFDAFGGIIEFGKNDRGEVTHLTFHVVDGDFRANRKK